MNLFARSRPLLLVVAAGLSLGACGGDTDDLDAYINEVKARPGGRIEPLPEITPYEGFAYLANEEGVRSPFIPDTPQAAQKGLRVEPKYDDGVGQVFLDPGMCRQILLNLLNNAVKFTDKGEVVLTVSSVVPAAEMAPGETTLLTFAGIWVGVWIAMNGMKPRDCV